jgi:Amino acid permease
MVLLAIPRLDPRRWLVLPVASTTDALDDAAVGFFATPVLAGVHWRPLLNSLFWNLNSFDVGASFAGEVRDPERVFPRAMFLSVVFVVLSYLLPLLAALGAVDTRQEDWDAGFFTTVAIAMGGAGLGAYTVLASAISNIALFEAEMSGDAYQLMGMADRGLIPKWFTKRSRFGTPVNGIVTGTIVIILMSVADFDQLVEMLNFAYSLSILLEYAAFAKLRITDGDGTSCWSFLSCNLRFCIISDGCSLCVDSRSSLQNTFEHVWLRVHDHSTVSISNFSLGDRFAHDVFLLFCVTGLWRGLSILPKGGQALQLGAICGSTETNQEENRRRISYESPVVFSDVYIRGYGPRSNTILMHFSK